MPKETKDSYFDTFAWLIHREVEQYVNENKAAYQTWTQENTKKEESQKSKKDGDF